ncbi:mobilization protein [Porphyromonas gingivalis]|uniref:relaxase/mobilization nuclease domain-containing protein n=1 Tax=Porphyromonas gingivalis TaxID=837 RepID=UPI000975041E|nr:relaxase/mobilization nuclease domain-containing protein [Porphyromonas gingivalis]SJL35221.1 mobilization protein [Porphyromonas gingivalis]
MIAKIIKGTSFFGVLAYILGKQEGKARILYAEGVRANAQTSDIAKDFALQASMRPNVKKPVCHTILSFSAEDTERLSDKIMTDLAKEYLQRMGYADTQYLIVRHLDREHPHLHICINRVNNEGKTISDSNEKYRSTKVCKELTEANLLKWGKGKEAVKRNRLRGNDRLRYEIFDTIKAVLPRCQNWDELSSALRCQGIDIQFKTKGQSDQVEGVLFSKDGVSFSGSHIDRSCSYSKLTFALEQNAKQALSPPLPSSETESFIGELGEAIENFGEGLFESNAPAVDVAELVFQRKLRNQANKKLKRRRL